MKKAVIFDLDGTLADSLHSISYCMNRALKQHGMKVFETQEYKQFVGDGADKLIERVLEKNGDWEHHSFQKVKETYSLLFEKDCMYQVCPYEGITETLRQLKREGIKLAVLSNKPHVRTLDVIRELFGENLFDIVLGQREEISRKPSPEGVFYIADKLAIPLEKIAYVGDTNTDMQTGKGAGVFTVGVLWGFRDRAELEANHADEIIAKPQELLSILKKEIEKKP